MKTDFQYKVIIWDINRNQVEYYDIVPYLSRCYNEAQVKPTNFDEMKTFILNESRYMYWSRCEYEIVVTGFPIDTRNQKIDVFNQIEANINVITDLFIKHL